MQQPKSVRNIKRMVTDTGYANQPVDSSPYMQNVLFSEKLGMITNEDGFLELDGMLNEHECIVGQLVLNDNSLLSFVAPKIESIYINSSFVIVDKNAGIYRILETDKYSFNPKYPIQAEFKTDYRGHRIVYWVSKGDVFRRLDLDDIPTPFTDEDANLSKVFNREVKIPKIGLDSVNDGDGQVKSGAYQFSVKLIAEDKSETDYLSNSGVVPIVDNVRASSSYHTYDGCEPNTPTSKSIKLIFSNIDTSYKYLLIAVIKTIGGIVTSKIIAKEAISSSTMYYTYRGSEQEQDVDLASLIVPTINYDTAGCIAQKDGRLELADLTAATEVDFQQYVNDIKTGTVFRPFAYNDRDSATGASGTLNNYKDEKWTYDGKSYAFDEVVPLAIQLHYKNGSRSAPYHIAGREIGITNFGGTIDASENTTVNNNDSLPFGSGNQAYWKVYNTGLGGPGKDYVGQVVTENGFWQSSELYPDDFDGLAGTPIRHHRISDDCLPIVKDSNGKYFHYSAGIRIGNIVIPKHIRSKIQGFSILRGIREEQDKSVIAKGFAHWSALLNYTDSEYKIVSYIPYFNPREQTNPTIKNNYSTITAAKDYLRFYSPDTHFRQPTVVAGDYIKLRAEYSDVWSKHAEHKPGGWNAAVQIGYRTPSGAWNKKSNYKVEGAGYINNNCWIDVEEIVSNRSWFNENGQAHLALKIDRHLDSNGDIVNTGSIESSQGVGLYCYVKRVIPNQYGKLENIRYVETNLVVNNLSEADFDSNDVYIPSVVDLANGKKADTMNIWSGDVFINDFVYRTTGKFQPTHGSEDSDGDATGDWKVYNESYVESVVNCDYRHESADANDIYAPKHSPTEIFALGADVQDNRKYNSDYSLNKNVKIFIPDADDAEFANKFPNRVIYSEKDLGESIRDFYTVFLANNYKDLSANKGKIRNMFVHLGKLFVHTDRTLYDMRDSQQKINTDESNVYIGTGEVFGLDPVEILDTKEGFGGSLSKDATVSTPFGTSFVDVNSKHIFLFTNGLSPDSRISLKGMANFFEENIPVKFRDSFSAVGDAGQTYNAYVLEHIPSNVYGCGWLSAYDAENKRILFTKRDGVINNAFKTIYEGIYSGEEVDEPVVAEGTKQIKFNTKVSAFELFEHNVGFSQIKSFITFESDTYIDNLSFTISYNVLDGTWSSVHTFLPTNMVQTGKELYMTKNYAIDIKASIARANKGKVGDYFRFDKNHKFIIEVVHNDNPTEDKVFTALSTEVEITDNKGVDSKAIPDKFFDNIWVYNNQQCSGELTLSVDTFNSPFANSGNVKRSGRDYRFNTFYNKVTSGTATNIFTKKGIDKEINPLSLPATDWFKETRFVGKYLVVRFIGNNLDNNKFSLYLFTAEFLKDNR